MTALALDAAVSSALKNGKIFSSSRPISPSGSDCQNAIPRINLRKRPCSANGKANVTITAVNSAFLSGLFADVAAAQSVSDEVSENTYSSEEPDHKVEVSQPRKKSRISLSKSLSRCGKSFGVLSDALHTQTSPAGINTAFFDDYTPNTNSIERDDSLNFQLKCVSDADGVDTSTSSSLDAATLVFPHLPNTVSNSSCATSLTRNISDLQTSEAEVDSEKESSYGWFVEMEDNDRPIADPYATSELALLAFSAPTAPKASNYDAELEWAQAADTVDDVLGDFF